MLQGAPPRGPRGASTTTRGRGRGGIQKRRADGPVRVDRDGDLVMDAEAAGAKRKPGKGRMERSPVPTGSGRTSGGRPRGGAGMHKAQAAILRGMGAQQANVLESRIGTTGNTLEISGLGSSKAAANPDGGVEALLAFLERKASGLDDTLNRTVKIKKSLKKGDKVIITASPQDIMEIQKLDGFQFAGTILSIKASTPIPSRSASEEKKQEESPQTTDVKAKFRAVLEGRYNPQLKLWNLSALAIDPGLVSMGLFDGSTNTSKVFPALMAVCNSIFPTRAAKKEAVVSVTLADNNLSNVGDVNALAQTFPDLKNLDLSRNNLVDIKSLDGWRYKFKHLENLVLTGNPIEAQLSELKDEFLKRYPDLSMLNNVLVRSPAEIAAMKAAAEAAQSPIPIAPPEFRDVGQVGENFIRQFLALYDTDRMALLTQFYDSRTSYSLAINMSAPRSHTNSKPIPPWAEYIKHSRNMIKITHAPARMNRQYKGVDAIKNVWASLPATRHPDLQTQTDKYIIECRPTQGLPDPSGQSARGVDGLIITIHGEFEEPNTAEKGSRSFSRSFVLGPGAPGIQPIRVISDMLLLRAWAPLAQPKPHAMMPTPPQEPAQMATPEQQQQEAMAMQLMEKTGMTLQYAGLCLVETGWNLENAYVAFMTNKDKLPPDAFLANVAL
ncbi:uncharacterized protein LY89DRAFT_680575 [Mollisia scopiformis]|uniref:mRNA export factor MEX67 n=1 Tax=Mollisia scopiformis TaxID=149040 RepID=A0A194XQJ0_MOLSC|nr:uncharacterized protein LY89DRAFT_680575 [Mollisia scopiformis]KUJ22431.1 hypothetical protein LY89DRAFT_680575 [Mollisia scopiformis]